VRNTLVRINAKGHVNLSEIIICVLGGLLSAYHLSWGDQSSMSDSGIPLRPEG